MKSLLLLTNDPSDFPFRMQKGDGDGVQTLALEVSGISEFALSFRTGRVTFRLFSKSHRAYHVVCSCRFRLYCHSRHTKVMFLSSWKVSAKEVFRLPFTDASLGGMACNSPAVDLVRKHDVNAKLKQLYILRPEILTCRAAKPYHWRRQFVSQKRSYTSDIAQVLPSSCSPSTLLYRWTLPTQSRARKTCGLCGPCVPSNT